MVLAFNEVRLDGFYRNLTEVTEALFMLLSQTSNNVEAGLSIGVPILRINSGLYPTMSEAKRKILDRFLMHAVPTRLPETLTRHEGYRNGRSDVMGD